MNAELSLAVAIMVALIGIAAGGITALRNRGMPMTRDEWRRKEIEDLKGEIADARDQINMLLEDRANDRRYIVKLEKRVADLERELAYFRRRTGAGPKASATAIVALKRLTGRQLRNLRTQLLDAYTTHEQWHALVQDADHQMDVVAMGDNLNSVVAKILNQANAEGWIRDLIVEAARQRPNLGALHVLARGLLEVLDA